MTHYILNGRGEPEPADLFVWARWFEASGRLRQIGQTQIGEAEVSTVFLGIDHSFGHGRPLLWETMVFGGSLDKEMYRYETRQQAMKGHEEMVERVRKATPTRQISLEDEK